MLFIQFLVNGMIYLTLNTFIGRFHPLVVHLPIGFLLLGTFFLLLSLHERFVLLKPAVSFSFGAGALASLIAIITGYFLSGSGDYDEDILANHQLMGYVTTALAFTAWLLYRKSFFAFQSGRRFKWLTAVLVLGIVSYTGHLGGSRRRCGPHPPPRWLNLIHCSVTAVLGLHSALGPTPAGFPGRACEVRVPVGINGWG